MEAVPDSEVDCVLVAVTVMLPAVEGAVKTPAAEMVPPVADQLTAEL